MIDNAHYWRAREERMRTLASKAADPMTYLALMHSAETYMGLAERAERREQMGTADSR